jgi:low affinity Fe/Cu permease
MLDKNESGSLLERASLKIARGIGTTRGFLIGLAIVAGMFLYGYDHNFDTAWHWKLHTTISLITFILLFITSRVEQKEMTAVQLKLNELLAAKEGASNRMINAEDAPESHLKSAREAYSNVSDQADEREATSIEKAPDTPEGEHRRLDKAS